MTGRAAPEQHRGRAKVYVEDPLTHMLLTDVWHVPRIKIEVTRGRMGVLHMAQATTIAAHGEVFGVVDSDFDPHNETEWNSSACRVFRLPVHEVENLLLDFDVLATLSQESRRRTPETAAQIRTRARDHATGLVSWMACRAVLRAMQQALGDAFPADPAQHECRSLDASADWIAARPYWVTHAAALARWQPPGEIRRELDTWEAMYRSTLEDGSWVREFSGKELFRYLRSHVPGLDTRPASAPTASAADRDLDLARRVVGCMKAQGRHPEVLTRLLAIVCERASLLPQPV